MPTVSASRRPAELALHGGPKAIPRFQPQPYPLIGAAEVKAVVGVLKKRHLSELGRAGVVGEMEQKYARYFKARHAHAYNAGTAAIAAALYAVGVRPGDRVLTASHTWISAICAIMHAGGVPVFCDVEADGFAIDPREIARKGRGAKAVIVTHLWGIPADMRAILKETRRLGLAVVEDCSHAHGGMYRGKALGTLGDIGCYSLQGSKGIVAGEGGILLTNRRSYYERSMIPGDHGVRLRAELTMPELMPFLEGSPAHTFRIPPMSAAVAMAQLDRLETLTRTRAANHAILQERLEKVAPFLRWPVIPSHARRGWYNTVCLYEFDARRVSRDRFLQALVAEGVPAWSCYYGNYYTIPLFQNLDLYRQFWPVEYVRGSAYRPLPPGALPHTDSVLSRLVTFMLPHWPAAPLMRRIAAAVAKVARRMDRL